MSEYQCGECGSYAINIDPDREVCDVCYWKLKYEEKSIEVNELLKNILKNISDLEEAKTMGKKE